MNTQEKKEALVQEVEEIAGKEAAYAYGVGLAAPQVGMLKRIHCVSFIKMLSLLQCCTDNLMKRYC